MKINKPVYKIHGFLLLNAHLTGMGVRAAGCLREFHKNAPLPTIRSFSFNPRKNLCAQAVAFAGLTSRYSKNSGVSWTKTK